MFIKEPKHIRISSRNILSDIMLLISIVMVLVSILRVESCQPELVEGAADLVSVGYDRLRTTALFVDSIEVKMKNKRQKFSNLLTPSCNSRRHAMVKLAIRKHGSEDWDEMEKDINESLTG